MKISKIKTVNLTIIIIVFLLVSVLGFQGCFPKAAATEEITATADTTEEDVTETTEESDAEDETDSTGVTEITGDINILNGMELSDSVKGGRPFAIMVENTPDARPQSGLIHADIVFEVVDEYGVTRYVVVFSSNEPDIIGPVRSARIYYGEIARSFDPIYTFWGTYPDCYPVLQSMDMDLMDANSDAYVPYTNAGWRDWSRNDVQEHTAFIDIAGIKEDAVSSGYSMEGGQSPMRFKIDASESDIGNITDITVDFSHSEYKSGFTYDSDTNSYLKTLAGAPHTDYESGEQLSVNNVIVLITDIDGPIDQYGHMVVRTTGTHEAGKAYYFFDGNMTEGTWGRNSIFDPFEFEDQDGNPVLFNRGSTWICMIQSVDRLSY